MNGYRVEYREKGIPGTCYKYPKNTEELLGVLDVLRFSVYDKKVDYNDIEVYREEL